MRTTSAYPQGSGYVAWRGEVGDSGGGEDEQVGVCGGGDDVGAMRGEGMVTGGGEGIVIAGGIGVGGGTIFGECSGQDCPLQAPKVSPTAVCVLTSLLDSSTLASII